MRLSNTAPKVLCIAKNYFEHALEMGATDVPPHPVIFQKPLSSIIYEGTKIRIPPSVEVHHEVELAVQIGKAGSNILAASAYEHVSSYLVALDLTGRNVQAEAKKNSWPWDVSKGFDTFLPLSGFVSKDEVQDPYALTIELKINGETKQRDVTGKMHYKIHDIIEYISRAMTLNPGDIILTGTPVGVGPIRSGDVLESTLFLGDRVIVGSRFEVE